MNAFARAGFAAAVLFLALTALFTPQHVTNTHRTNLLVTPTPAPREPISTPQDTAPDMEIEDGDAAVDLYGNEVSPAIATYSLDALGSLYEVHSPQTELPRLGSPKT